MTLISKPLFGHSPPSLPHSWTEVNAQNGNGFFVYKGSKALLEKYPTLKDSFVSNTHVPRDLRQPQKSEPNNEVRKARKQQASRSSRTRFRELGRARATNRHRLSENDLSSFVNLLERILRAPHSDLVRIFRRILEIMA